MERRLPLYVPETWGCLYTGERCIMPSAPPKDGCYLFCKYGRAALRELGKSNERPLEESPLVNTAAS